MDKIYGFKQKDVEKLIKYLDGKQGGSLSKAFEEFAAATGKSKGTVRNMYYAVAKKAGRISPLPKNISEVRRSPCRRFRNSRTKRNANS